jgi:hypothetical protein
MNAAVLDQQPPAAIDPTAALAAVRDRLSKAREVEARWRRDVDRCANEITKFQEQIAAVSSAESALIKIHELRAAGEPITPDQIGKAEHNLKSAQLLAGRAELAVQGARAAAAHLAEQLAEAQREVAMILAEAKKIQGAALRATALESRDKFRAQAAAFIMGAYADHMAVLVAANEAARQFDLLRGLDLPGPILRVPHVIGSAVGSTPDQSSVWKFDASAEIDAKAAAILVSMLKPLAV